MIIGCIMLFLWEFTVYNMLFVKCKVHYHISANTQIDNITTVKISTSVTVKVRVIRFSQFLWFLCWLSSLTLTIISNGRCSQTSQDNILIRVEWRWNNRSAKSQMVMKWMVRKETFWIWFYISARSNANYTNSNPPPAIIKELLEIAA